MISWRFNALGDNEVKHQASAVADAWCLLFLLFENFVHVTFFYDVVTFFKEVVVAVYYAHRAGYSPDVAGDKGF